MSDRNTPAGINPNGPFLTAALFCEGISHDDDGVPTAHRIIDAVSFEVPADAPPDFPSHKSPLIRNLLFFLVFKTDSDDATYHVKLVCEHPDKTESVVCCETIVTGA